MADQQQQNAGEVSQPYIIPPGMTPDAAAERAQDLITDRDFAARLLKGGKDSREAHELDALQRRSVETRPEIPRKRPVTPADVRAEAPASSTIQASSGLTTEQARDRLAELRSDTAWSKKFLAGDRGAKREFDRLSEIIAAQLPEGTSGEASKTLTAAEARAAALEAVPDKPQEYGELPFRHDDMPPPEGITEIQGLMHTAGLTRNEAQTMISFAANDVVKWAQMDEASQQEHLNDTRVRFHKIHGDEAAELEAGARRLIAEITAKDGGRLREILLVSGAGASLAVWNAIAAAAKRKYGA